MMMNGKERVKGALRGTATDRVPWVPFAGVHAGKLLGHTATAVLTDGDKLLASLLEVNRIYDPDGQPVLFDLQVEAEILGCNLVWSDAVPPAVASHPLSQSKDVPCVCNVPEPTDGRLPMILRTMAAMKQHVGERTALYGLICGPFTLASHLRGVDLFMDTVIDAAYVKRLISYTEAVTMRMADLYIDAGMDVIAVVDPVVSQISPAHFTTFLSESFTRLFTHIRNREALSSLFVCGDATKQLQVMCATAPDGLSVDENVDMVAAKAVTDAHQVTLGGNIPLTSLMLHGSQQDNIKYVVDLLDKVGAERLIVSPGCDMPYDTPASNVIAASQAVRDPEAARSIVAGYESTTRIPDVKLPNYAELTTPLVEVFTLDSASCAACTYMMAAANRLTGRFGDRIDVVEHKYTVKENIRRCQQMGITNLPALYVNGELAFSSLIPSEAALVDRIEKVL